MGLFHFWGDKRDSLRPAGPVSRYGSFPSLILAIWALRSYIVSFSQIMYAWLPMLGRFYASLALRRPEDNIFHHILILEVMIQAPRP